MLREVTLAFALQHAFNRCKIESVWDNKGWEPIRLKLYQLSASITMLHAHVATAYAPYMIVRLK